MSGETLREAVEAALKEVIEGARPREPVTYAMAADAAIRTVLERAAKCATDIGEQYGMDETGWADCSETIASAILRLDAAVREVG